ncbi:MAG: hypothetical protein ACRBBM_00415 [Pseudomonadaceae bacterium]
MFGLILGLMLAVAIVNALRPKQEQPAVQEGNTPTTEEGVKLRKVYGTVWIKEPSLVAFKKMGTVPIRSKGGKK